MFDGDGKSITKNEEHVRRGGNASSPDVVINDNTNATIAQENFLVNTNNKTRFIALLTRYLREVDCIVH